MLLRPTISYFILIALASGCGLNGYVSEQADKRSATDSRMNSNVDPDTKDKDNIVDQDLNYMDGESVFQYQSREVKRIYLRFANAKIGDKVQVLNKNRESIKTYEVSVDEENKAFIVIQSALESGDNPFVVILDQDAMFAKINYRDFDTLGATYASFAKETAQPEAQMKAGFQGWFNIYGASNSQIRNKDFKSNLINVMN